jgi:hypothetical protein
MFIILDMVYLTTLCRLYIYISYVAFNGYANERRMLLYDTVPPFVGRFEISEFPQGRKDGI